MGKTGHTNTTHTLYLGERLSFLEATISEIVIVAQVNKTSHMQSNVHNREANARSHVATTHVSPFPSPPLSPFTPTYPHPLA